MQHHFVSAPLAVPFIGTKFPLCICTPHRFHECKISSCFALAPVRSSVNIGNNLKLTDFIFWLWAVLRGSFLYSFSRAIREKLIFKIPPSLRFVRKHTATTLLFSVAKRSHPFYQNVRNDVTLGAPQR